MYIFDFPKDIERIILLAEKNENFYFLFELETSVNFNEGKIRFSLVKKGMFERIKDSDTTVLYTSLTAKISEAEELAKALRLIIEGKKMKIIIKNNDETIYKS